MCTTRPNAPGYPGPCGLNHMRHAVSGLDFWGIVCYYSLYKKLTKVVKRKGYMNPFTAIQDLLDEHDYMGPVGAFIGVAIAIIVAYITR